MHKKLILIFAFVLFLNFPQSIFASVVINEVQIGSEESVNDEFIELYNTTNNEIDLTGWSIYKKTSGGNESSFVSKSRFENIKIPSSGTLFLAREGQYLGTKTVDVFWPSSYSLASNNSLALYKDFENKIIEDQVSWGEVKNFKRTETNLPTENTDTDGSTNTSVNLTTNNSSSPENVNSKNLSARLQINTNKIIFTGVPTTFEALVLNEDFKNIYGKFLWNFGDGHFKEFKSFENHKFLYTYFYPGKYNVYVEYYKNNFDKEPLLKTEILIEVLEQSLEITRTGVENDFFIEIANKSNSDLDLSGFFIVGENKEFVFPAKTFLKKNSKIILSPMATNFNINDKNFLEIKNTFGKIIFSNKIIENTKTEIKNIPKSKSYPVLSLAKDVSDEVEDFSQEEIYDSYDLVDNQALAFNSTENANLIYNNYYFLGVLILIILGILFVVFIRKNKIEQENIGEDFEILDE